MWLHQRRPRKGVVNAMGRVHNTVVVVAVQTRMMLLTLLRLCVCQWHLLHQRRVSLPSLSVPSFFQLVLPDHHVEDGVYACPSLFFVFLIQLFRLFYVCAWVCVQHYHMCSNFGWILCFNVWLPCQHTCMAFYSCYCCYWYFITNNQSNAVLCGECKVIHEHIHVNGVHGMVCVLYHHNHESAIVYDCEYYMCVYVCVTLQVLFCSGCC